MLTGRSRSKVVKEEGAAQKDGGPDLKDDAVDKDTSTQKGHAVPTPIKLATDDDEKEEEYVCFQKSQDDSVMTPATTPPGEQHIYQDIVPMMACRFVTDLGLDQRALDITLALMGLYQRDSGGSKGRGPKDRPPSHRILIPNRTAKINTSQMCR